MLIIDLMNPDPSCIYEDFTLLQATLAFSCTRVSELMVVDKERNLIGLLGEGDLLRLVMPDFEEILAAGGSLLDAFTIFGKRGASLGNCPIAPLIIRNPPTATPGDEAAQVVALMLQKHFRSLPVTEGRKLLGTVSRLDICRAVICGTKFE